MWHHGFSHVLITYLYLWVFSNWVLVLEYLTLLKGEIWKRISLLRLSVGKMEFLMSSWIPVSDIGVCSVEEFLTAHSSSLVLSKPTLSSSTEQLCPEHIWLRRMCTFFAFRCTQWLSSLHFGQLNKSCSRIWLLSWLLVFCW